MFLILNLMAKFILKRKIFFIGLGNLGNAITGMNKAQQLTGAQRAWEATKGITKLGVAGTAVAAPIMAIKGVHDIATGKPLES